MTTRTKTIHLIQILNFKSNNQIKLSEYLCQYLLSYLKTSITLYFINNSYNRFLVNNFVPILC